jgi:hypothetical protein
MRLSFLILMLPAIGGAASAGPPPTAAARGRCPSDPLLFADRDRGGQAQPRKLGELPPGRLYLSVDRQIDGCRQPVIVRYGIGAVQAPPPAPRK